MPLARDCQGHPDGGSRSYSRSGNGVRPRSRSCRMFRGGHPHVRSLQPQVRKGLAVQETMWALKVQRGFAGATVWRASGAAPGAEGTMRGGPGVGPVGPFDGRGRARGANPVRLSR